jgi:hypothetical protein
MALSSNMFGMGKVISDGRGGGFTRWMVFLTSQFLFGVALTNLYLGMRGVMRLGGFVASGGPYEIAHQAPGWIWIMPVSIFVGLISVFVSFGAGGKLGGPNLMALAWSALFTSLGWNFMEFGFSPPGGQGLSWGWIICGVVFIPMGLIPLWIIIQTVHSSHRKRKQAGMVTGEDSKNRGWGFSLLLQLIAVGLGIYLGIRFFDHLTTPPQPETTRQETIRKTTPSKWPQGTVEFQKQGKILALIPLPDGTWDMVYEDQVYERIRDLPRDIQRLFKKSLEDVKGVKK